jgi:hypothetical protein
VYTYGGRRGRFKGPLYGGEDGIERALRQCRVSAVVVIDRGGAGGDDIRRVREYARSEGALDVFEVRISVGRALAEVATGMGVS